MKPSEHAAMAFHEAFERLGPSFGRDTVPVSWAALPPNWRRLMVATVEHLVSAGVINLGGA